MLIFYNNLNNKREKYMNIISKILSIQVGKVVTLGDENSSNITKKQITTASYKHPIFTEAKVTKLSIIGDSVADTIHHGGVDKAIFANSFKNYKRWQEFLNKDELSFGALGENLTFEGIDEEDVCIGDDHKIGSVTLEVSQPRQPCWKISRMWEQKDFMQEIYTSGRTGWYYRVLQEGSFKANDMVELVSRVQNPITILEANKVMRNPKENQSKAQELLSLDILALAWSNGLRKKL